MKKASTLLTFIIFSLLIFASCGASDSFLELSLCGSYAVPGMFSSDLKGNDTTTSVLEYDNYGRILYEYTAVNVITEKEETALIICQKIDDNFVFFYEDQCYLQRNYREADISTLKENNDWGKPLDYSKMARRNKQISFDMYIITDTSLKNREIRNACIKNLDISDSQLLKQCFLDVSPIGQELYYLCVELDGTERKYFAIVGSSYEVAYLEIIDDSFTPSDIAKIKFEAGWAYGF